MIWQILVSSMTMYLNCSMIAKMIATTHSLSLNNDRNHGLHTLGVTSVVMAWWAPFIKSAKYISAGELTQDEECSDKMNKTVPLLWIRL